MQLALCKKPACGPELFVRRIKAEKGKAGGGVFYNAYDFVHGGFCACDKPGGVLFFAAISNAGTIDGFYKKQPGQFAKIFSLLYIAFGLGLCLLLSLHFCLEFCLRQHKAKFLEVFVARLEVFCKERLWLFGLCVRLPF